MRIKLVFISGVFLILLLNSSALQAQFSTSMDYSSSYIWRGFDLNPTKKPVLQPSIGYEFGRSGLNLKIWGSFSFYDKEANEFRLIFSYAYSGLKNIALSGGLIHYGWYFAEDFDFGYDTSHEVFVRARMLEIPLEPALTVFYDFTNGKGFYILLQAESSFRFTKSLGASLWGSLGYNGGQWLAEGADPGLSDCDLGLDIPVSLGKFDIVPFFRTTFVLLDAIGKKTYFWYGLSVQFNTAK